MVQGGMDNIGLVHTTSQSRLGQYMLLCMRSGVATAQSLYHLLSEMGVSVEGMKCLNTS